MFCKRPKSLSPIMVFMPLCIGKCPRLRFSVTPLRLSRSQVRPCELGRGPLSHEVQREVGFFAFILFHCDIGEIEIIKIMKWMFLLLKIWCFRQPTRSTMDLWIEMNLKVSHVTQRSHRILIVFPSFWIFTSWRCKAKVLWRHVSCGFLEPVEESIWFVPKSQIFKGVEIFDVQWFSFWGRGGWRFDFWIQCSDLMKLREVVWFCSTSEICCKVPIQHQGLDHAFRVRCRTASRRKI